MNLIKHWSLKALALGAFLVAGVTVAGPSEARDRWGISVYGGGPYSGYSISYNDRGRYYGGYRYDRGYRYAGYRYGYRDYRPYYRDYGYYAPGYYYNAPYSYYNVAPAYEFTYYSSPRHYRGHRHHGHRHRHGRHW
jgi:hypothetical protein